MTQILRRVIDAPLQAWRNGGGSTRELLAWPAAGDWQLRVSVADIESDGAFSPYPGVERWFTVLQGAGVELVVDGDVHRLARGDAPLRFDGAAAVHAHLLDGPTRDLNLMLQRATGTMQTAADGLRWSPAAAQCGLFSAVAGRCEVDGADAIEVPAYALLWFDAAPTTLTFNAGQRPAALIGWWLAATPQEA
jgi:environmental stress-induced protein Ves